MYLKKKKGGERKKKKESDIPLTSYQRGKQKDKNMWHTIDI